MIRNDANEVQPYDAADILHVVKDSKDGIRGRSIFDFAAENLGMHRTIAEAANAFFKNAVQPSLYVNQLNPSNLETRKQEQKQFEESYAGSRNAGKVPFVANSEIKSFPGLTAEETGLLEALNTSIADVARWFGCSASDLGDRENSKYNSLAADEASFFKLSLAPVQIKLQNELNIKVFGSMDTFAEFETKGVLRGDPIQESQVIIAYVTAGLMTREYAQTLLNLPTTPGADVPLYPANQAVVTGAPDAQPLTDNPQELNVNTSQPSTI